MQLAAKKTGDKTGEAIRSPGSYLDDRMEDREFRVDRSIYLDDALFDQEMTDIFENTWVFLCHESQVAKPGDYFSTYIGRQPVYLHRAQDGALNGFMNVCTHRGAILTPYKKGNARTLTCRFHGWTFDGAGTCLKVKSESQGYDTDAFNRSRYDLARIPKLQSYCGFVFGSLNEDAPTLEEHLGEAAKFIEFIADQSAAGMEVVKGTSTYMIDGNWKLQVENAVDGYHVGTVHRVFASTVAHREARGGVDGMMKTESGRIAGTVESGCYDLGGGHMVIWAERSPPDSTPLFEAKDRLERDYSPEKVKWMLGRGRNLIIFPNLMINDFAATQLRTFRPLSADRTEVQIYCIAPSEESKEARYARLRKFEDFFLVTGMATSDDVAALEDTQAGSRGLLAGWGEFNRGIETMIEGPDEPAKEGGFSPASSNSSWDHETLYFGMYRKWLDLMTSGEKK